MIRPPIAVVAALTFAGCVPPPPATTTSPVYVASSTTVVANPVTPAEASEPATRSVVVFVDKRIGRATEVIGVLDFHSDADSQDKGFDELRARAAAMGADAVIGAEFEHGANDQSHLSGIAVRFLAE